MPATYTEDKVHGPEVDFGIGWKVDVPNGWYVYDDPQHEIVHEGPFDTKDQAETVAGAARRAPRTLAARARVSFSFSDAAYRHYDTSEGFGSADEWMAAAEELASGRSTLRDEPKARKRTRYVDPRLRALGLDAMPTDIRGLKRAFREALFRTHPDHGGTSEACREVLSAYEQLVRRY